MDIIRNPIVLAVLAGALTYLYLMWTADKKKDPKSKKDISLLTPLIVSVIVFVLAYGYFNYSSSNINQIIPKTEIKNLESMTPNNKYHFVKDISESSPQSFHLLSKGLINIPNNLTIPDVFIETTY